MKLSLEYPTDYLYTRWPFEAIERLKMNKVQELVNEIETIRDQCVHLNVVWVNHTIFKSSLVPRYFILFNEEIHFSMVFSTKCTDCDSVYKYHAKKTCPICFNEMKEDRWVL